MTKLHRLDYAVDDQRRAEPCSEPEEQHLAFLIAAERLHRRIIEDLVGRPNPVLKSNPIHPGQILWIGHRPIVQNRAGIADRHHIVTPSVSELSDSGNHLLGRHFWPGSKLPLIAMPGY